MSKHALSGALGAAVLALAAPAGALAQDQFDARLNGFQEVPSVSTTASGQFTAQVSADGTTIEYELNYSGFGAPIAAAHVHFGRRGANGGVIAFLCGGGGKPDCPAQGPVTGTIDATAVVGPQDQGIAPGEIAELVRALRAGAVYANVHTSSFPDGEIRGQVSAQLFDLD
jgi:hypothetical protein